LDKATHIDEIGPSTGTHLRIDYRNSGVGSQSCGPELNAIHRITEKEIRFAVSVRL
jgi:beta-galactosidase